MTDLPATVRIPDDGTRSPYAVINKGIWDALKDILSNGSSVPTPAVKIFVTGRDVTPD